MKKSDINQMPLLRLALQANAQRQKADYRRALDIYLQAVEKDPLNVSLYVTIARTYYLTAGGPNETGKNFETAVVWMEKAVNQEPNNPRFHAELGDFYALAIVDYQKALNEYRRAIEINANETKALVGIAGLYGVPEEVVTLEEAISSLQKAVKLEPDDHLAHSRLGDLYFEAHQFSEAQHEWLAALLCSQPLYQGNATFIEGKLKDLP